MSHGSVLCILSVENAKFFHMKTNKCEIDNCLIGDFDRITFKFRSFVCLLACLLNFQLFLAKQKFASQYGSKNGEER